MMLNWTSKLKHPIMEIRRRNLLAFREKLEWGIIKLDEFRTDKEFLETLHDIEHSISESDYELSECLKSIFKSLSTSLDVIVPSSSDKSPDVNVMTPLSKPHNRRFKGQVQAQSSVPYYVQSSYLNSYVSLSPLQKYVIEELVRLGASTNDFNSLKFESILNKCISLCTTVVFLQDPRLTSIIWQYLLIDETIDSGLHYLAVIAHKITADLCIEESFIGTDKHVFQEPLGYFWHQLFIRVMPLCRNPILIGRCLRLIFAAKPFLIDQFISKSKEGDPLTVGISIYNFYNEYFLEVLRHHSRSASTSIVAPNAILDSLIFSCCDFLRTFRESFAKEFQIYLPLRNHFVALLESQRFFEISSLLFYVYLDQKSYSEERNKDFCCRLIETRWLFSSDTKLFRLSIQNLRSIVPEEVNRDLIDIPNSLNPGRDTISKGILDELDLSSGKCEHLSNISSIRLLYIERSSKNEFTDFGTTLRNILECLSKNYVELWNDFSFEISLLARAAGSCIRGGTLSLEEKMQAIGLFLPLVFHRNATVKENVAELLHFIAFNENLYSFVDEEGRSNGSSSIPFITSNASEIPISFIIYNLKDYYGLMNSHGLSSDYYDGILTSKSHEQCHKSLMEFRAIQGYLSSPFDCNLGSLVDRFFSHLPSSVEDYRILRHILWALKELAVDHPGMIFPKGIIDKVVVLLEKLLAEQRDIEKALLYIDDVNVEWKLLIDDSSDFFRILSLYVSLPALEVKSIFNLLDLFSHEDLEFASSNLLCGLINLVRRPSELETASRLNEILKSATSFVTRKLSEEPKVFLFSRSLRLSLHLISVTISMMLKEGQISSITNNSLILQIIKYTINSTDQKACSIGWKILASFMQNHKLMLSVCKAIPSFLDLSISSFVTCNSIPCSSSAIQATISFTRVVCTSPPIERHAGEIVEVLEKYRIFNLEANFFTNNGFSLLLDLLICLIHYVPEVLITSMQKSKLNIFDRCISEVAGITYSDILETERSDLAKKSIVFMSRVVRWLIMSPSDMSNNMLSSLMNDIRPCVKRLLNILVDEKFDKSHEPFYSESSSIVNDLLVHFDFDEAFYERISKFECLVPSRSKLGSPILIVVKYLLRSNLYIPSHFHNFIELLVSCLFSSSFDADSKNLVLVILNSLFKQNIALASESSMRKLLISYFQFDSNASFKPSVIAGESLMGNLNLVNLLFCILSQTEHMKTLCDRLLSECLLQIFEKKDKRIEIWKLFLSLLKGCENNIRAVVKYKDFNAVYEYLLGTIKEGPAELKVNSLEVCKSLLFEAESRSFFAKSNFTKTVSESLKDVLQLQNNRVGVHRPSLNLTIMLLIELLCCFAFYPEGKLSIIRNSEIISLGLEYMLQHSQASSEIKRSLSRLFVIISLNKEIKYLFISQGCLMQMIKEGLNCGDDEIVLLVKKFCITLSFDFQKAKVLLKPVLDELIED